MTIKEIVLQDQEDQNADDYTSYLQEVCQHGCVSGIVSGLIYYTDTLAFYQKHQEEINDMLKEAISQIGDSPTDVFGDKWDKDDPLAMDTSNQNLLVWFAYEETARAILEDQGVEV